MDNDFAAKNTNQDLNKNFEEKTENQPPKFNVIKEKKSTLNEPLIEKPVSKKMFLIGLITVIIIIIVVGIGSFLIGKNAGSGTELDGEGESEIIVDDEAIKGYDYGTLYDEIDKASSNEESEKIIEETFAELEKSNPTEDKNEQAKRLTAKADAFMYAGILNRALELISQDSEMNVDDWNVKISICSSGISAAGEIRNDALYEKYQNQCQELFANEPEGGEGGGD